MGFRLLHIRDLLYLGCVHYIYCVHLFPSNNHYNPSCCGILPYGTQSNNPLMLNPETDPYASEHESLGLDIPPPFVNPDETQTSQRAYSCSLLMCSEDMLTPVCACNFITGNVVTFKNSCDMNKHNCRFDTAFKAILNEICPWEFKSRRSNNEVEFDYSDPKYYNNKD